MAGAMAASGLAGTRDALNAQQYMQEMAAKLNSSSDKGLLLWGANGQSTASSLHKPAPTVPGSVGQVAPSPAIRPPQVVPPVQGTAGLQGGDNPSASIAAFKNAWNDLAASSRTAAGTADASARAESASSRLAGNPPPQMVVDRSTRDILGPLGVAMASTKPGLTLWTTQSPANLGATMANGDRPWEPDTPEATPPWSLGADLDKYRQHAVREGSRDSRESLKKAFARAGLTLEDGVNVFFLGYGSDRGAAFRQNDGKGFFDEPGKVPQQVGVTAGSLGDGVYSVADLILLNSLPDSDKAAYRDNHPAVRPFIFTGQTIGGVWKTAEEAGNAITWGYFDNITGCIGLVIEDILQLFKHAGEAATNLVRAPVHLIAGQKEETDRDMDWVLLVPLEFLSNAVSMKGVSNMQDYEKAFEDKGVIGSLIEFGGSSFLVYRAVDRLVDELEHKHHKRCKSTSDDTPADSETPPADGATEPPPDVAFLLEGDWPLENGTGTFLIDGVWTTVKIWRE
jgi:hypothetical protein